MSTIVEKKAGKQHKIMIRCLYSSDDFYLDITWAGFGPFFHCTDTKETSTARPGLGSANGVFDRHCNALSASPADATPTKKGLGISSPVMCPHAITAMDPLPCTSLPRHHVPLVEDHNTQFDLLHLLVMLGDDVRNNSAS